MRLYDVIHYRVHVIETPDCVVLVFLPENVKEKKEKELHKNKETHIPIHYVTSKT